MELQVPVIGILRGVPYDFFGPLMAADFSAGLQAIEVTFNTERAEEMVAEQRYNRPAGKLPGMSDSLFGRLALAERSAEGIEVGVRCFLEKIPQ